MVGSCGMVVGVWCGCCSFMMRLFVDVWLVVLSTVVMIYGDF